MKITKTNIIKNIFQNRFYLFILMGAIFIAFILPLSVQRYIVPSFYEQIINNTLVDAKKVGTHIARHQNGDVKSTVFYTAIHKLKEDFNIYKIRLFDEKGKIVFSTVSKEIGDINKNNYYFDVVAKGEIFYKVVKKGTNSLEGTTVTRDVAEIYVPIMSNNNFKGSSEIYYDITDKKIKFNNLINQMIFFYNIFAILFLMVSFFVIYILSKNNLKELNSEQLLKNKVDEKTKELQNINKNLETRIKQEVEKNRERESQLFQQSKLASMGEMIGNIAHQWRQPLSAITSTSSALKLNNELDLLDKKEINEKMDTILDRAHFLSSTIENFRSFFSSTTQKAIFDVAGSILKVENIIQSNYSNENIKIIHNFQNESIMANGLEGELTQVILNVLNNSYDNFINKNIETRYVKISLQNIEDEISIKIQDTGDGIPADILPKIFEPYFTTKHQSQGTGIGLYMSSEIINKHFKGKIIATNENFTIDNQNYKGACFTITFKSNI